MTSFQENSLSERDQRLQSHGTFYQYQPVRKPDDDRLSGLEINKLWISDPVNFRDPLDLRIPIRNFCHRGPFDEEDRLKKAFSALLVENPNIHDFWLYDTSLLNAFDGWIGGYSQFEEIIRGVERRFRSFGVSCFTIDPVNPLMWSHYADQHEGFCVEYAVRQLDLAVTNPSFSQYYVQYVTKLPELCLSEVLFSPHQLVTRMLATKTVEWAYEREWRLVNYETKGGKVDMPQHMQLSALIAGFKMEPDNLKKLRVAAGRLGVPALQVRQRHGYELVMEPLA